MEQGRGSDGQISGPSSKKGERRDLRNAKEIKQFSG